METAIPKTKYLKLIDLSPAIHTTIDVIVNAVTANLEQKASPAPGLEKLVGAASDRAL